MKKDIKIAKEKYEKENNMLNIKSDNISSLRLILFIILLITYFSLKSIPTLKIILSLIILSIFLIIVIYHNTIIKKIKNNDNYLNIIKEYEDRTNGNWKNFTNTGIEIDNNELAIDLDLVGKNSLFQLINTSKSINGKRSLINKLINPKIDKNNIIENQESIKELSNNFNFILDFQNKINTIKNIENIDYQNYTNILDEEKHISKKELIFGIITSTLTDIILLLSIFNVINIRYFITALIIDLIISYIYSYKYNKEFDNISQCSRNISNLKEVYETIINSNFKYKKLNSIKNNLTDGYEVINKLEKISILDSYRFNFITNVILNAIMSLNIVVLYKYNTLIAKEHKIIKENINNIEELENLISFTTIPLVKNNITLPSIADKTKIEFTNISHPLLEEDKCITNSFSSKDDINIITGSNMSGKTSFMKTIAINLILMYNGSYVNAESFSSSLNKIFTSIKVTDDIERGISTFYGELLRIQKILEYKKDNKEPIIVFIDEIFKGTNYNDRILGAKEIIKKLSKYNCIVIITTHDFELCEIENKKIYNYHFEEQYIKDKITFDYKIKEGMCTKTNAKYLMEQIGILTK